MSSYRRDLLAQANPEEQATGARRIPRSSPHPAGSRRGASSPESSPPTRRWKPRFDPPSARRTGIWDSTRRRSCSFKERSNWIAASGKRASRYAGGGQIAGPGVLRRRQISPGRSDPRPAVSVSRRKLGTSNSQTRDAMSALGLSVCGGSEVRAGAAFVDRSLRSSAVCWARRIGHAQHEVKPRPAAFHAGQRSRDRRLLNLAVQARGIRLARIIR